MGEFASKTTFPKSPPIILGDSQYVGSFYETGIQLGKNQKRNFFSLLTFSFKPLSII